MFTTTFLIAIPILFVLFGAVGALSFAMKEEPEGELETKGADTHAPEVGVDEHLLLFDGPDAWHRPGGEMAAAPLEVDQLLARIESDLRDGRRSAELFAKNPSGSTLHIN